MKLITISASSIHAAMADARLEHGDDIILVESKAAEGNRPAEITIAIEKADRPTPATVESLRNTSFQNRLRSQNIPDAPPVIPLEAQQTDHYSSTIDLDRQPEPSKRRLFVPRLATAAGKIAERLLGDRDETRNSLLASSLNVLDTGSSNGATDLPPAIRANATADSVMDRLDVIERSLSRSNIAFANRWINHPLYAEMIQSAYSPETIVSALSTLASRGVPANADIIYLRTKVFEELRRRSRTVVARPGSGRHLVLGSAGSGKTNLILKAAQDPDTLKSGRSIVLTLGDGDSSAVCSSVNAYSQNGVEVLHVHSQQQLSYSKELLSRFETVFIDTAPLAPERQSCQQQIHRMMEMIRTIENPTIHYCVDARRELDDVSAQLADISEQVDAIALTNLDGISRYGRLIEFLVEHDLPVYLCSRGRYAPGTTPDRFTPSELMAASLNLEEWPYTRHELSDYFGSSSSRSNVGPMDFGERLPIGR